MISAFLMLSGAQLAAQGSACGTATQVCLNNMSSYPAAIGSGDFGNFIGCLTTTPNPFWVCFQVEQPGRINIKIEPMLGGGDLDFACWGPFSADSLSELHSSNACSTLMTDSTGCVSHASTAGANPVDLGGYPIGNLVDCSYSSGAVEYAHIPNAQTGEWYLLLLTNYSNLPTNISFVADPSSVGSSDCAFCAGINDFANPKVIISPNPASDMLNCTFETKRTRKLSIVDIAGKTIIAWESNQQKETFDAKSLSNGIYFLKVEENGNQYSSKFVIRKD
jgi:hypothetical protein